MLKSSSNPCSSHIIFPLCCQVQILSLYPRSKDKPGYRAAEEETLLLQLFEHTRGIAVLMAQQGCRRTQKIYSRLHEAAWKLCNDGFSVLWVHSLVQTTLMLWGPLSQQTSMGVIPLSKCGAVVNAWCWRPLMWEMRLIEILSHLIKELEGRGEQAMCHQGGRRGDLLGLHRKLAETRA